MGKHSGAGTSENRSYEGKHRASDKDLSADTVPVRVDTDDRGRMTGFSVGRETGPDNYSR
jgi:hypothetical protein